jgi:pimeloyl-ACP methyl ester carboxylesterase
MMAAVRNGYVDCEWGQVHYRRSGESGPWIALFHESPLSSAVFDRVLPLLGERMRAVAFDTPGYGASSPPDAPTYEIPDYARILSRAAEDLGMVRPILAGVHTGASIAIAASGLGGGAAGLILTGIPLYTLEERRSFTAGYAPPLVYDEAGSQFTWAIERYRRIWGPNLPADLLQIAVVELMRAGERYDWGYQAAFRWDPAPLLQAFDSPVLLLDAEFDALAGKDALALELAGDAELAVLPGLPGQPHLRDPQRYAELVFGFLGRVSL